MFEREFADYLNNYLIYLHTIVCTLFLFPLTSHLFWHLGDHKFFFILLIRYNTWFTTIQDECISKTIPSTTTPTKSLTPPTYPTTFPTESQFSDSSRSSGRCSQRTGNIRFFDSRFPISAGTPVSAVGVIMAYFPKAAVGYRYQSVVRWQSILCRTTRAWNRSSLLILVFVSGTVQILVAIFTWVRWFY